jgi:hypothetical protein
MGKEWGHQRKDCDFFSGASMLLRTGQVLNKQILDPDKELSFFFFWSFPSVKPKDYKKP